MTERQIIMSETVLILRASKWEMADEKTGEIRKGCTIHYINDYQVETANAVGDSPMKVQASDEVFTEVKSTKHLASMRSAPAPNPARKARQRSS
jgi:hypothetical protein